MTEQTTSHSQRPELSSAQRAWLKAKNRFPPTFEVRTRTGDRLTLEILDRDASGHVVEVRRRLGFKGFVLKARDANTQRVFAAKFCVPEDYDAQRTEIDEARMATKLQGAAGLFAIPWLSGRVEKFAEMPGKQTDLVCFLVEWVEGHTIEQILLETPELVTPEWIVHISKELYRAIHYLEQKELKHDDLHTGNIMLRLRDPDLALDVGEEDEAQIVIIDTGSLKPISKSTPKSHDDHTRYVETLIRFYNVLHASRYKASEYPQFIGALKQFLEKLCDEDLSRHFPSVKEDIVREIQNLKTCINAPLIQARAPFTPFDAISAEHLADDRILLKLFVGHLPWMPELFSRSPCILTGPRGCGKSMVFRFLAAKTHLGDPVGALQRLSDIPFLGVFIGCSSELQNNLLWLARNPNQIDRFAGHITGFFQLVVLRELFRTLAALVECKEVNALYGIDEGAIDSAIQACERYLPMQHRGMRIRGVGRAQYFSEELDRARITLHIAMLRDEPAPFLLPDELLKTVTASLQERAPALKDRPLAFLLDDYTEQRISKSIQRVLNKIVWQRCSSHVFKVSCEKFGFDPGDIDRLVMEPDREYATIDAGASALDNTRAQERDKRKQFVIDLLDRRLEQAQWKGRAEALIGSDGCKSDKELAIRIRKSASPGKDYHYHGLTVLSNLWSGDIASLLHVIREMFVRGGITKNTTNSVAPKDQHEATKSVSAALNARIRAYHPYGHEMHQVVTAFGTMVRDILVNGRDYSPGRDKEPEPRRMIRLEMATENAHEFLRDVEQVSPIAASIARELIRRAIFIELTPSRPKEGQHLQTIRWQIRRILLPAHGSALLRTSYIDVKTINDFAEFFVNPKRFCDAQRIRYGHDKDTSSRALFETAEGMDDAERSSEPALEE